MADARKVLGQDGEKAAVSYLKKNKYTILETNHRTRHSEIDIIAKKSETLCFIEVKTRKSLTRGLPRESVNYNKQQKIILGARGWLQKNKTDNCKIRFDVIEVFSTDSRFDINHIKHAFQAG